MKKPLIVILLVVFLLTMIVPTVFAAAPPPKDPNPNKDCFGKEISNLARSDLSPVKNFGQLIKDAIHILGWSVSEMMHNDQACRKL